MEERTTYTVGELARLSGLTPKALRHYDQLGLLTPVALSRHGYRLYGKDQLGEARRISRLRELDLPLETVRALLTAADDEARSTLMGHRVRLQARDDRLHGVLHTLTHLIEDERGIYMALDDTQDAAAPLDERALAARLFNETWALLGQENRTPEDDDRMVHMAHASRFHWDGVGTDQHRAIGEWQVSRVHAVLGHGEAAVHHAERAVYYAGSAGVDGWVLASAHEGLARAHAVAGHPEEARLAKDRAVELLASITDEDDRAVIGTDIDSLPI